MAFRTCLLLVGCMFAPSFAAVEWGIAQNYPGDAGLKDDPDVLLFEDFEGRSISDLRNRWSYVRGEDRMHFSNEKAPASAGLSSLYMDGVNQMGGGDLFKQFGQDYNLLYFRYYVKFSFTTCQVFHHGSWLGGFRNHDTGYWGYAGWGSPPQIAFSAGLEPLDFTRWDIYAYSANMQRSTDGVCWGNVFGLFQNQKLTTHRDQWECIENMIKMNTHPDSTNGEVAGWINGEKVLHLGRGFPMGRWAAPGQWTTNCRAGTCIPFPGFQWSPSDSFKINWAFLEHFVNTDTDCQGLYDNVVVAKKYIGPIPGSVGVRSDEALTLTLRTFSLSARPLRGGTFEFDAALSENGPLQLDVFLPNGKRVWSYSDPYLSAGTYTIPWNHSFPLPQGIFLVRMRSGNKVSSLRLSSF